MSFFSDLLGRHIAAKGIKSTEMARYCGMERSFMYKIIKGTRQVANLNTVLIMADYLRLTPSEKSSFIEAYKISTEGLENYYRRRNIMELFQNFRKYSAIYSGPTHDFSSYSDTDSICIINGEREINHLLLHILFLESKKSNPQIRLLIQPDYDFLMNLLPTLGYENKNLSITHIICFNTSDQPTIDKKTYNLSCLKKILPVYSCACNYNVYYYYGNLIHSSNDLILFPYLVLTSEHALLLSKDMHSGILFHEEENLRFFKNIFESYVEEASSFGVTMNDLPTQLNYFYNLKTDPSQNYCFQMLPCLTHCIPDYFFEKYITPGLPCRSQWIDMLLDYVHQIRKRFSDNRIQFIFSEEGVRRFLDTGRIPEYPPAVYLPFDAEDRVVLLSEFFDRYPLDDIRMLKRSIGDLDNELFMYANRQNGYLMFPSSDPDQLICLDITEPGLLQGFCDFCEHLDEDLFYTSEETQEIISSLIGKEKSR